MKIVIMAIGKTDESYIQEGMNKFLARIQPYCQTEIEIIAEPKNHSRLTQSEQIAAESRLIEERISTTDMVVLLDEKGKQFTSREFARQLEQWLVSGRKRIVFVIGGPYGIHENLKNKYPALSLSTMTFNHQLIRLIFAEQLYRAFSILKGFPYHNE